MKYNFSQLFIYMTIILFSYNFLSSLVFSSLRILEDNLNHFLIYLIYILFFYDFLYSLVSSP